MPDEGTIWVKGIRHLTVSIAALVLFVPDAVPMPNIAVQEQVQGTATVLFCAFGSVGLVPVPRPAGFESEFAVAVVGIKSSSSLSNVPVSDFVLLGQHGETTAMKRVVQIDVFEPGPFLYVRPGAPAKFGYYLNPGPGNGTHAWDGTLPAGKIRLRIRVALNSVPLEPERFRLRLGPYLIEGPVDGAWPT
jgi:hypothetical protein